MKENSPINNMVQHYKICVNKHCEDANWRVLDGCSTGWIVTEIVKSKIYIYYIKDLSDLKNNETCLNFVDIPVCLPVNIQDYPRQCDYIAKKILGRFHSSIFYAPLKAWLGKSLEAINSICQNQSKPKLSKQSFNLFKKIIDVQKEYEKKPIFWQEIHPELLVHFYTGTNKFHNLIWY